MNSTNANVTIREVTTELELERSAHLIRESFATVAAEFGITPENWPRYSGFVTLKSLKEQDKPCERQYGLFSGEIQVGFAAVSGPDEDGTCWLRRVAVLPEARRKGYGEKLVDFAVAEARRRGATKLRFGVLDANERLKAWYENLGFRVTHVVKPPDMAWSICLMEKDIGPEGPESWKP